MSFPDAVIKELEQLPQHKPILCQVVAADGSAWNCEYKFYPYTAVGPNFGFNLLTISHPELKTLKTASELEINPFFKHEDIAKILNQVGFVQIESCCSVPDKYCGNDVWRGNMEGLIKTVFQEGMKEGMKK